MHIVPVAGLDVPSEITILRIMAPLSLSSFFTALTFITLPGVFADPACARRYRGSMDCVSKCKENWGYGGLVMGQQDISRHSRFVI